MITWMQRHKKWLIITIWVSTISFVGAGFVGWGQYSYGDKAGAVAKVGNIEISQGELQKTYSNLYAKFNQMFQGNFDEEKAKQFGLQKQALKQLIQQALLLNLASDYDLSVSDAELVAALKKQNYFFKNGVFDKETYKQVLSQNRLTTKEFEDGLKKDIIIQKLFKLLPVTVSKNETNILETILNIADKLEYKVLTVDDVKVDTSDDALKAFWEGRKSDFMNDITYDLKYIKQEQVANNYDDATISKYYAENKTHFKGEDGKILPLTTAKEKVVKELNAKATKDKALRGYIAYKKGKLSSDVQVEMVTISASNNPFTPEVLSAIAKLSPTKPFMKPILVNGVYYTFELVKTNMATPKSFEEAKEEVAALYAQEAKQTKLQELANSSVANFSGTTTDFLTASDAAKLTELQTQEAGEFLQKLFSSSKKRSYIKLNSGKIVLYSILEQKLLNNTNSELADSMKKIKSGIFNEALIKTLQKQYPTEIFIQGL